MAGTPGSNAAATRSSSEEAIEAMCGICGVLNLGGGRETTREHVEAMARVIFHRGPDDAGYFLNPPIAFGFRRLSIVDLSGGHQPMSNEDGTVWIVFNGEIYNHADLRPDLERRGHRYSTRSDTETIIHLYEEYGDDCVHHLRGMFAFAIWDSRKRRLFCARDRLGIKPFYYALSDGRFAFASEMKALFELPGLRPELNRAALPEFFALGYLSATDTLFQGITKLLPGHRLSLSLNDTNPQPRVEPYWDLDITPEEKEHTEEDYIARFRELFTESVRLRLMSDVPLGVFLSGGLDSSSIAAVMAGLCKNQIKTFSVGYAEDRFSELPYARKVAQHIGAEYNEILLGPDDFLGSLPQLIWHEDEPIVWPSSVALHFVSRLARQKVKVVLTGEGGDEVFAGYMKYRATLFNLRYSPSYETFVPGGMRRWIRGALNGTALPESLRRKFRHTFLYYPGVFENIYFDNFYSVFPQSMQSELFAPALADQLRGIGAYATSMNYFHPNGSRDDLLTRLLYLDIKTYLVELLMKQDQMSMAASIESRVPFLDHKLVEFAMRIPPRLKVRYLSGKYLLRRAMEDRLPGEVLNRIKRGFPTPVKPWLRYQLFDRVASILSDGRLAARGILNANYVRDLLEAHRAGRVDATDAIWRLLNFELWNRVFFDRDPEFLNHFNPVANDFAVAEHTP
jgi:asparagine synthase (glutamine-hydrolysing)